MLNRRELNSGLLAGAIASATPEVLSAQAGTPRALPPPQQDGGKPLMVVLKQRHSVRDFADRPLPPQQLSNLLWASFGINRSSGDRTAPTWRHIIFIDLYVALPDGAFLYDAKANALVPVLADDIRADTGAQDFVGAAALNIIYVARTELMGDIGTEDKRLWATANVGFVAQNLYLYCGSEGLATVFRATIPRERVAKLLKLPASSLVIAGQSVGYPKA